VRDQGGEQLVKRHRLALGAAAGERFFEQNYPERWGDRSGE
jgi:hypothetical protein